MMKKVALISPKGNIFGKNEKMRSFLEQSQVMKSFEYLWSGPNLGLLTLAALLPADWECDYIDENYVSIDFEKCYDVVFIGAMTQQVTNAYHISDQFRRKGILTVMGGIHPTLMPEEALQHADVVFSGEAEPLIPGFLTDYQSGTLRKIYREENPGHYPISDSPIPRFDLLKGYPYPIITLQTTRGCPRKCSFCAASRVFGVQYRRKENSRILAELKMLSQMYPGILILFADDNMLVMRRESKELLRQMIELDLRWLAQTDISIAADDELLALMVQAGCQWIVVGFESTSYHSLQGLDQDNWKLKQLPGYPENIQKIQDYGIGVYGTFIVGLDCDDATVFKNTAGFIKDNRLYGANITLPTPLPGTELREKLLSEGRVLNKGWEYYTFWDVTIQPKQFSVEELEDNLIYIYNEITDNRHVKDRMIMLKKMMSRRNQIRKSVDFSRKEEG